ncbi:nuclear transport factor 2 family protein [Citrobacter sp. BNK-42]|uniref:nuclear transport factor 2 family protein n=1 Tax=Citrobacter sp. BNK-42 TaxID=3376175 RepID=UPI003B5117D0
MVSFVQNQETIEGYLGLMKETHPQQFIELWDDKGVWDYPAPGGTRNYADTPERILRRATEMHSWLQTALSIECAEVLHDEHVSIVEWVAHFPDRAVHNCSVVRFYNGKIILIRDYYDVQRCPERNS